MISDISGDEPLYYDFSSSHLDWKKLYISDYFPFNDGVPTTWLATSTSSSSHPVENCSISQATVPLMISSPSGDELPYFYELSYSYLSWKMFDILSYCPFNDLLPIRWWATTTSSPPLTPDGKCLISQATVLLMISSSPGDEPLLRVLLLSPQLENV